jgi:hypothetical protein
LLSVGVVMIATRGRWLSASPTTGTTGDRRDVEAGLLTTPIGLAIEHERYAVIFP